MALSDETRQALAGTLYGTLLDAVENYAEDYIKAKTPNKKAATRTRVGCQVVRNAAFEVRKELGPKKKEKPAA